MSFSADSAQVCRFAKRLTAVALDTVPAHNYLGRYSDSVSNGYLGMFTPVFHATRDLTKIVSAVMERAAELSDASAAELHRAAKMYRDTDYETARRLDETY